MNLMSRFARRRTSAQGTVEFAMVVSVFFLLLLGVMEFGWALYTQSTLGFAANEGARRGMVLTRTGTFPDNGNHSGSYSLVTACNPDTIVGTVRCRLGAVSPDRTTAVLVTPAPDPAGGLPVGARVDVRLDHTYRPLIIGFFPFMNAIAMTGHAETRAQ